MRSERGAWNTRNAREELERRGTEDEEGKGGQGKALNEEENKKA